MSQPTKKAKPPKPPNLVAELRRDAVKGKVPNMPRSMYRGTLNALLDKCDWSTGRNAFISKATIGKGWTGGSERKIVYDLKHLRDGGWISEQAEPDGESARLVYYGDGTEEHPGIRADRRPKIYCVNFLVFYAEPRPVKGCKNDTPTDDHTGCKNDTPTGCRIGSHGVQSVAYNLPSPSDPSDLQVTDSLRNESLPEKQTPPCAAVKPAAVGGRASVDPDPSTEVAPGPPTRKELRRTVLVALKILKKPAAIMKTPTAWKMIAALEKITTDGRCCLECALLVPWWVEHGSDWATKDHQILAGLNQRKNLAYLWSEDVWGNLMGDADAYYREERLERCGEGLDFDDMLADLGGSVGNPPLYEDRWFPDDEEGEASAAYHEAICKACVWCLKRRKVARPAEGAQAICKPEPVGGVS